MMQKNNDMLIVNKTQSAFTKAYAEVSNIINFLNRMLNW